MEKSTTNIPGRVMILPIIFLCLIFVLSCSKEDEPTGSEEQKTEEEVTTKEVPELETNEVSGVAKTSAVAKGHVTYKGSSSVIQRGVCWSEISAPTIEDDHIEASSVSASGAFTAEITGLKENTTYYLRAYATNSDGTGYGEEISFTTDKTIQPIVFVDSSSFESQEKFEETWKMLYPWGEDHNGSARMYPKNVNLKDGHLEIHSEWINWDWEGYSTADPHLRITFHSGAIHYKEHIRVTEDLPYWEISGDFQAATVPGSWPAFWISGAWSWPPEIDIMEFKGSTTNWQNTVTGPAWNETEWTTEKTVIPDAATTWHNYKLTMQRIDDRDVLVKMYIDDELRVENVKDFSGDPFWLIINMQMEGSSGATNDDSVARKETQYLRARNVYVGATPAEHPEEADE